MNTQNYCRIYFNGIIAVITEWFKEDCQKSIEEIAAIIHIYIHGRE